MAKIAKKNYGTKEIGEILLVIGGIFRAYRNATADGKIDFTDIPHFVQPITRVPAAIKGAENVVKELLDLDKEEIKELMPRIKAIIPNEEDVVVEAIYHFLCFVQKGLAFWGDK